MTARQLRAAACLGLILFVVGCSNTRTTSPAPTPSVAEEHIDVGGLTRDYLVAAPLDVADHDPLPLLLVLHGATQTMADAETWGYDTVAAASGAVVAYPQGQDRVWNAGATDTGVNDVAFIAALVTQMKSRYPIDPQRVFIAGGSNGGQMAYRAACELADDIAAVADLSGALLVDCQPTKPVSVIDIHGTADSMIPIEGGGTGCRPVECPPLADTLERWIQIDGCTGDPTETTLAEGTDEATYANCRDGTAVTAIRAAGVDHVLSNIQIDVTAVTWQFLTSHPRPAS